MSLFQVLDANVPEQRATWLSYWRQWSVREVSVHPDYVRLFQASSDSSLCAAMVDGNGGVMFPFLRRSLSGAPWCISDKNSSDLVTPYGYGGPFAWGQADASLFWRAFDEWAGKQGIVSVFARLALFPDQMIPFSGDVQFSRTNVVRSLGLSPSELWADYEYKVRKNVKRAEQNGLTVDIDPAGTRLGDFLSIYYSTMDRREASTYYRFPSAFFESLICNLTGQFMFFHTLRQSTVIASELVLVSEENLYSFLGGTQANAFEYRPNDLLKHAIITWGSEQGKKRFVLGGGYQEQDGIFRYKLSFAPSGAVPFLVGKRILNEHGYLQLLRQRRAWEADDGRSWTPAAGFFPAYRG